jgi:hypothetical protein
MTQAKAQAANDDRRFRVHVRGVKHHARVLLEPSFEAAAVAFVEDYAPAADDEAEIAIIVQELDDGAEHCFRIDMKTGEAEPCG